MAHICLDNSKVIVPLFGNYTILNGFSLSFALQKILFIRCQKLRKDDLQYLKRSPSYIIKSCLPSIYQNILSSTISCTMVWIKDFFYFFVILFQIILSLYTKHLWIQRNCAEYKNIITKILFTKYVSYYVILNNFLYINMDETKFYFIIIIIQIMLYFVYEVH